MILASLPRSTMSRARVMAVAFLGACLLIACTDTRRQRSRDERVAARRSAETAARLAAGAAARWAATPAAPVEPTAAFCTDSTESAAMRCADGVASRSGDTVIIRLSNVGAAKRADHPEQDDAYRRYYYAGRFGGENGTPAFHILDIRNFQGGAIELINAATGDSLLVRGIPVLSPDGARFAAVEEPEACELPTQLEIWRVTGDKPVREHVVQPFDCNTDRGWGPSDVTWRSRDTITFLRNELPVDSLRRLNGDRDTTRALLVRVAGAWKLDSTMAPSPRSP